ncbi:hypothetical protein LG272_09750 [Pseudidiomarina marina]|uniref:Uncharacterized protein n=1 Tax=Pseudidiomarina marina TaxID=502366 RepID=A0A432YKK4_9GAMM|nr:hypothetical protein [Pseudidiomarina marina]PHR66363.1 MAG: hypothetical protein COA51_01675 [Idiomarina sp.]RUO61507.1 hypothetical protein CWI76_04460 [Pseudidiomarina marina]
MENFIAALLFAVLVGAGSLGLTSLGMFAFHRNENRDEQQRERLEYAFFGVVGIVVMLMMWYAL